jgi:cellulose synthase/poly-beta-1,6-N-acetylglucosamine synthase-like glycosyltransferase
VALCIYVYFGYPLLLLGLGLIVRRPIRAGEITPSVVLIVPVYNEQQIIESKLINSLALDYPQSQFEVLIVSDGSTDHTKSIVKRYGDHGVRLLSLPRVGKAIALNEAVASCVQEIIVFSDANAELASNSLRALVRHFYDPEVGGVCGNQNIRARPANDSASAGESFYWTYDKWLKRLESRLGATVAADGSIYAVRRALYVPISDPAQADDFAISARVVTQGFRLLYDSDAVSVEDAPASSEREFWRKVRVATHTSRSVYRLLQELRTWRRGFFLFKLISHKVLRYLVPLFMFLALGTNVILAGLSVFFKALLILQILFYSCALAGYLFRRTEIRRFKVLYIPYYFCLANVAVLLGILGGFRQIATWEIERDTRDGDNRKGRA